MSGILPTDKPVRFAYYIGGLGGGLTIAALERMAGIGDPVLTLAAGVGGVLLAICSLVWWVE